LVEEEVRVALGARSRIARANIARGVARLTSVVSSAVVELVVLWWTGTQAIGAQQVGLIVPTRRAERTSRRRVLAETTEGRAVSAVGGIVVKESAVRARTVTGVVVPSVAQSLIALVAIVGSIPTRHAENLTRVADVVGPVAPHLHGTDSFARGVVGPQVGFVDAADCRSALGTVISQFEADFAFEVAIHADIAAESVPVAGQAIESAGGAR